MANLLRRTAQHDMKKATTLVRSKTYGSDLTTAERRLQHQNAVHSPVSTEFDYKRDTKYLAKVIKQCITAHSLDLNFILHYLLGFTSDQRVILVRDLEFEYEYKLIDMVLEQPDSPIRSCTLAMLMEPIDLYVHDFHDLLLMKQLKKINDDISRKLLEILLPLSNEEIQKFKGIYEQLFESTVEKDIELVQGADSIVTKLLQQLLDGNRYEESGHSATIAKAIAKKLYEAGEGSPGIDYDIFVKIFTHDAFSQLSAIFDVYEDKYGRPIQVAIEHEFHGKAEIDCFQDMVEYVRSPSAYHARIVNEALQRTPIDYVTVIRTIIGHQDKDLHEISLEYSKIFDETIDETIKKHVDIHEVKRVLVFAITNEDISTDNSNQINSDHSHNNLLSSSGASSISSASASALSGMRRNRSQEAFDKVFSVFKTIRH